MPRHFRQRSPQTPNRRAQSAPHGLGQYRGPARAAVDGLDEGSYVYYVHSYAPQTNADTIARTTYGETFSAAIRRDNFFGTQFHPEKSASVGERILQNFLRL